MPTRGIYTTGSIVTAVLIEEQSNPHILTNKNVKGPCGSYHPTFWLDWKEIDLYTLALF